MNFEYNGNLEEKERIIQVAQEIMKCYPEIDLERAKLIASLEEPITTDVNSVIYFKRLYNMLFVVQKDKTLFNKVYIEIVKIYNLYLTSGENDNIVDSMMSELNKYVNNERIDFPIVSEFY